jgi:tRNA-specific 2-thiouridylase
LGIAASEPLYVLGRDGQRNALIVGNEAELGGYELKAAQVNWIDGQGPVSEIEGHVKIRYHATDAPARIKTLDGGLAQARFMQPMRDITPGQRAVFYQGEVCLGGGTILG